MKQVDTAGNRFDYCKGVFMPIEAAQIMGWGVQSNVPLCSNEYCIESRLI
jgi:hypothetical protein